MQGHLADAINYATSKRVGVISMSLGYQGPSRPVRVAISKALARGIVVVASSGNSGGASSGTHGNAPYSFPADYPGVLGVGAVAQDGLPAGFSSDNLSVQVAAPGVRVPAQGRDGQYWLVSGTSPACALTAGVAALIKSVYPALAPALVAQAITSSTRDKPRGGYDEQVGSGTVDATAALRMAGRLARDQGAGRGLVATAQFGGGTGAIPPVPVAPRTNRQFLVDSLIALACLAVVLIVAFRLIVTRRPAAAGVPGGWSGAGPVDPRTPGGWSGAGPVDPRAPGGWAGAGPADARASGGWAGGPAQATGPPDAALPGPAASGAGGAWRMVARQITAARRLLGPRGLQTVADYPSSSGYGSSDGPSRLPVPGRPRQPAGAVPPGHERRAIGQPIGYRSPEGYRPPVRRRQVPPAGAGRGRGFRAARGSGHRRITSPGPVRAASGFRRLWAANRQRAAAGYGRSTSPHRRVHRGPGSPGRSRPWPAIPRARTPARSPGSESLSDPGSQAEDPPAADDDTWPSSGQW